MEVSIHDCSFGKALICSRDNKLYGLELGENADQCYHHFINRWSKSSVAVEPRTDTQIVDMVLQSIETGVIDPNIKIDLYASGTFFQHKVWQAILEIPAGKTSSYKEIAQKINRPDSFRAVGTACGANPIAIIVPCHRVVKSDGGDGGYRWGLDLKKKILQRELGY